VDVPHTRTNDVATLIDTWVRPEPSNTACARVHARDAHPSVSAVRAANG
jgi:hypothetical protein